MKSWIGLPGYSDMAWVQIPGWPDHLCQVIAGYTCTLRLNSRVLFGHVARLHCGVPARDALDCTIARRSERRPPAGWKRPSGRLRQTWITQIGDGTPSGVIREFNRASGRGHTRSALMAKRSEGRKEGTHTKSMPLNRSTKKIGTVDYVSDGNPYSKFGTNQSTGCFWANGWNVTKIIIIFIYLYLFFWGSSACRSDS